MTAAELVYRVGDRIRGWGRLIVDDEGQWLDLSRVVPLSWSPGPRPRSRRYSIPLVGSADLAAVPTEFGPPGVYPGSVTLTGTWDGSTLHVEQQSAVRMSTFDRPPPSWTIPPCPAPAGGWPTGMNGDEPDNLTFDAGDLRSTGAAVTTVMFRPTPDSAVLVVAATDAARVREVLATQLTSRLCIVPSTWTRSQLDAVRTTLHDNRRAWTVELFGEDIDDLAQASAVAHPMRVTAEMATWADSLPLGLLTLGPALAPVRESDTEPDSDPILGS